MEETSEEIISRLEQIRIIYGEEAFEGLVGKLQDAPIAVAHGIIDDYICDWVGKTVTFE